MSCNLQAEANVTGRGRAAAWSISKEVFFLYFRKKLRARATRNKENNNSGLILKTKHTKEQFRGLKLAPGVFPEILGQIGRETDFFLNQTKFGMGKELNALV